MARRSVFCCIVVFGVVGVGFAAPLSATSPCVTPTSALELAPRLAGGPKVLDQRALKPGERATVTVGDRELLISLRNQLMPAFVGSTQGEVLPFAEVTWRSKGKNTAKDDAVTQTSYVPAAISVGDKRVTFTEADEKFAVVVEDLGVGCTADEHEDTLKNGESRLIWLSTYGVTTYSFYVGESWNASDQLQLNLRSFSSPNSRRKVVLGAGGKPLTPGGVIVGVFERNDSANDSKDLDVVVDDKANLAMAAHRVEVVRVIHGKDSRFSFKEVYAPAEPVVSVLVKVTRKK